MIIRWSVRRAAFTVMELLMVVATIGMVLLVVLPTLHRHGRRGHRAICINSLKEIGLAFRVWSGDNNDRSPMQFYTNLDGTLKFADATNVFRYFQIMSNELGSTTILACPEDKGRSPAQSWASLSNNNLSYFIGLDADETRPDMLLAGDRNLTNGTPPMNAVLTLTANHPVGWTAAIHGGNGNVVLADGSLQQLSSARLRDLVAGSGTNLNRLLIP